MPVPYLISTKSKNICVNHICKFLQIAYCHDALQEKYAQYKLSLESYMYLEDVYPTDQKLID